MLDSTSAMNEDVYNDGDRTTVEKHFSDARLARPPPPPLKEERIKAKLQSKYAHKYSCLLLNGLLLEDELLCDMTCLHLLICRINSAINSDPRSPSCEPPEWPGAP